LKLGLSAKFLGAAVSGQLNTPREENQNTVMANLQASAFTVTMVAPQTPGAVFSQTFAKAALDQQIALGNIGPDNIPVYVSSVTYGKLFAYTLTSTASSSEMEAAVRASMKWGSLDSNLERRYKTILTTSKLNLVTIGGSEQQLRDALDKGVQGYLASETAIDSWVPISYEVRNLGDGSIAKISETTNYNLRECGPKEVKTRKVEVEITDVYKDAQITAKRDGEADVSLHNGGTTGRIDVSPYLNKANNYIVIGNGGGRPGFLTRWQRQESFLSKE
jgi:hypothetical protein